MIIIDYSQRQPQQSKTSFRDIITAGAIVIIPALFLLVIAAH